MDQDELTQLYGIADAAELETLDRLRLRAGLVWSHEGCTFLNQQDTNQCACAYQHPPARLVVTRAVTLEVDTAKWAQAREMSMEQAVTDFSRYVNAYLPQVIGGGLGLLRIADGSVLMGGTAAGEVHLAQRETFDGLFAFVDRDQAVAYAAMHEGADVGATHVLDRVAGAELIARTAREDAED